MHLDSQQLYSIEQIRQLERVAINRYNIDEDELMLRAGNAAFAWLRVRWPAAKNILVFAGKGNNGGDGLILAKLAQDAGLTVQIRVVGRDTGLPKNAKVFDSDELLSADVVVDALLGIGLQGDVRGDYAAAIECINHLKAPVMSIDVPSGIDADTGRVFGYAVKADATMTLIGCKKGLFTGQAVSFCGDIGLDELGLPEEAFEQIQPAAQLLMPELIKQCLPPRAKDTHKGDYGHVLVIGGDQGMPGAVKMAAEAAARVGAGLVTIATHPDHAGSLNITRPELMCHGISSAKGLAPLLEKATVIIIGPGLGRASWGKQLFAAVVSASQPKVLDADALFHLGNAPQKIDNWILTPHPGEAARLLASTNAEVQHDRFARVKELQQQFSGTVVLKGAGTLIASENLPIQVCRFGNPGMASGGMGDALSGAIAGLLAQGLTLENSANCGVLLHAVAGDHAADEGQRGLLAQDLIDALRPTLAELTS